MHKEYTNKSRSHKQAMENKYIGLEFSNDMIRNPKVKQTTKDVDDATRELLDVFQHVFDRKSKLLYLKYLFIWNVRFQFLTMKIMNQFFSSGGV